MTMSVLYFLRVVSFCELHLYLQAYRRNTMAPLRMWQAAAGLDMYRKVPVDLMEGTKRGSLLSYLALFTISTLFLLETKAFFTKR